ncbi:serine hydrolase [Streptomyces zinciresistens K42]|uniref:Serine hydrolase n=1 Tax=Streptomyces zinciresistens K42 TaxID=700597 RepID=G2GC46_9ACTN|nr:serine hydrolase [Streptomyces zinciresistens K42]
MYAALIGEVDGVRLFSSAVLALAAEEQAGGKDQVMLIPSRFSAGYMLPTESNPMLGSSSFGHTGRGGSLAFADPEHGAAFGYAMNNIVGGIDDVRASSLVETVREALAKPVGVPGGETAGDSSVIRLATRGDGRQAPPFDPTCVSRASP